MPRTLLTIATFLSIASTVAAQAPVALIQSSRAAIDSAYEQRDSSSLIATIDRLERALVVTANEPWLMHYRGFAIYRLVELIQPTAQPERLQRMLEDADRMLEVSGTRMPLAETFALRSSVYGLRIGLDLSKKQSFGMASSSLMTQARGMGSQNPRVLLLAGMSALYTPEEWGGGMTVAKDYFTRAQAALASDNPGALGPRWGRSDIAFITDRLNRGLGAP